LKGETNQAPTQADENGHHEEQEEEEHRPVETKSNEKKTVSKTKKKTKPKAAANSSTANLTANQERRDSADMPPKKSSISQLSTSKINSPLSQILHSPKGGSNNQSVRVDNNKSMTRDLSNSSIRHHTAGNSFLSSKNPNDLSVQVIFTKIVLNLHRVNSTTLEDQQPLLKVSVDSGSINQKALAQLTIILKNQAQVN
jgi:hypothetical protein